MAIAFKDNTKKWLDKYSLNLILIFYGVVFTLPTLFDKDLFGLGNGNNILTAFLLTTLGVIFSIKSIDKIDKPITLVFYGNHLPGIYSNIDINKLEARTADYFNYSNRYVRLYGARKLSKVEYISPNDFIVLTAKQVNAKISAYYALLTKVQEELPAMKVYAYKNGKNPVFVNNKGKTVKYRDLSKNKKTYTMT